MDKYAKRLQSRLSAKGFKFNKEQCRQALTATAANPELPTDEEMVQAFNWLTQCDSESTAGEIQTVTVEETTEFEPIPAPETFDIPVEDMPCLQPSVEEEEAGAIAPETEEGQSEGTLSPSAQGEQDLSTPETRTTGIVPRESGQLQQPSPVGSISQAQVTQAISQAIAQVGQQGNTEAVEMLTTLANQLSEDIADTQQMVVALVNAYLNNRQLLLASAIGTLNNLRTAQTESFQAGLSSDFFQQREQNKQEFLAKVGAMFN